MAEFSTKFIAFIDILGFKGLVERAEVNDGLNLDHILDFTKLLGTEADVSAVGRYGPSALPCTKKHSPNVDFQITQISDCVIVTTEVSDGGVTHLLDYCSIVVLRLLRSGVMCSGYITIGSIYHTPTQVIGSGYQYCYKKADKDVKVFKGEDDKGGPPFIEIDPSVCEFVARSGDEWLKMMFNRFTVGDGQGFIALYPFRRYLASLDTTISIEGLSINDRKGRVNIVRDSIENFRNGLLKFSPENNPKALEKLRHYRRVLDEQLDQCAASEEAVDILATSFPCHGLDSIFGR